MLRYPRGMDVDTIRRKVAESGISGYEIAKRSGLKMRWVQYFLAGYMPEPGYSKVTKVIETVRAIEREQRARERKRAAGGTQ